jgi:hypothetical protein
LGQRHFEGLKFLYELMGVFSSVVGDKDDFFAQCYQLVWVGVEEKERQQGMKEMDEENGL